MGCQTTRKSVSFIPASKRVVVESINVEVTDFHGRPDVFATLTGRLSSNVAQLVDVEQTRGKGNTLYFHVVEKTPQGASATNKVPNPPFQTRVPVDVLGLVPGQTYTVIANGVEDQFTMPSVVSDEEDLFSTTSSSSTGFEMPF